MQVKNEKEYKKPRILKRHEDRQLPERGLWWDHLAVRDRPGVNGRRMGVGRTRACVLAQKTDGKM